MEDFKDWIDNATYSQLLYRWRFASFEDKIFSGEIGDYYSKIMKEKKKQLANDELVSASKEVGWG